ncbi:MAG: 6-bladed beta-propeller [Bacteroidales bacterium]
MNQSESKYKSFICIIILIFYSLNCNVLAQEFKIEQTIDQTKKPHIEWIKTWPSSIKNQKSIKLKDRLNLFFFGIKTPKLINPVAIFANNPKDFWVVDQGGKTLFQVQNDNGLIPKSFLKSDKELSSLVSICSGSNSNLYFTDSQSNKIYRINKDKKKLEILNDTFILEQPTGIAYLPGKKELWVVETKKHCITVLNENGQFLKRIGKRGIEKGEFNYPTHIWIDNNGLIYITDAMNFRIQILNSEGEVITVFGESGDVTGFLARPKGIATDTFENIYVVDALFHVVQVFDKKGIFLYKFGSQGHENAEFWIPSGIYIDNQNYIYIADTYNSRVQIFQLQY